LRAGLFVSFSIHLFSKVLSTDESSHDALVAPLLRTGSDNSFDDERGGGRRGEGGCEEGSGNHQNNHHMPQGDSLSMATTSSPIRNGSNHNNNNNNNNTMRSPSFESPHLGGASHHHHSTSSSSHHHHHHRSLSSASSSRPLMMLRSCWSRCVGIPCAADQLPAWLFAIVTHGKFTALVVLGVYLVFLIAFWLPFWLLSFVMGEWGIYALWMATVVLVGRSIIRMIAFPGASQKVIAEMEREFARYSIRMISSSCTSFMDVAGAMVSLCHAAGSAGGGRGGLGPSPGGGLLLAGMGVGAAGPRRAAPASVLYDVPIQWRRAKTYRDRVIGVYLEVLQYMYQEEPLNASAAVAAAAAATTTIITPSPTDPDLTRFGNNRMSGDIGNLSGLTPQARTDGRELLEKLKKIVQLLDKLERLAQPVLETGSMSSTQPLPPEAFTTANNLLDKSSELRDYVNSLKPGQDREDPEADESAAAAAAASEEDLTVDAVRRRFEEPNASALDTIKAGAASVLPMLDPPPHNSIFGFDVQRGCMLSRYRGSRQLWVQRPRGGGRLDVLHFPARNYGAKLPRNPRAVLYCNPNAGLIEVTAGMSLVGGNVPSADADNSANDNSWVDFYTELGMDVYVFNYAGYGRSFGASCLVKTGANAGSDYQPGVLARLSRIFKSCFFTFQPTTDTLRADGIAVAQHLLTEIGIQELVIHGESIGGVAASGTARFLSQSPSMRDKLSLLLCDRTFCNLEAVAQRLVGGWSGYAIRALAPLWNTDVAGDFLAVTCPKVVANDAADAIIFDSASLKSGIALWKEIHRGVATTNGIGLLTETPLQYRMADWENVCVNDSRYVAASLIRANAPIWPADKHVTVEEAFHFAACCKRIGKVAKPNREQRQSDEEEGNRFADALSSGISNDSLTDSSLVLEAWKVLACCDGLTGLPLGVAVKQGFDATVSWLCSCLIFGGQTLVQVAEDRRKRMGKFDQNSPLIIDAADFDGRPPNYAADESNGKMHPKPIPEVIDRVATYMEREDTAIASLSHEFQFVLGMLQYIQARLSATPTIEAARAIRNLSVTADTSVGSFLNLHCGHNNPFSKDEKRRLVDLLHRAAAMSSTASSNVTTSSTS